MKKNNKSYAAPTAELIEIQPVSILMTSGDGGGPVSSGGTWRGGAVQYETTSWNPS